MSESGSAPDYGYGPKNGPHTWCLTAPAAAGYRQSPINIITEKCIQKADFRPLSVQHFKEGPQILIRKKHNFQIGFPQEKVASLEGGPCGQSKYYLEQFHFHWGIGDSWGSEHQVNGRFYPSELHLVFLNEKYKSICEALSDPEGLCVLGVFLQIDQNENPGLRQLIRTLNSSLSTCEKLLEQKIDIFALLPKNKNRYFTYEGSLTTPPCSECVRWIVFADPITISIQQLQVLRSMHNCEDCGTCETFRLPMPLGERSVYSSFKTV